MTKLLYDAIRGSSGTADSIQLHASNQSVTFPGNVTCSGTATGFGGGKVLQYVHVQSTGSNYFDADNAFMDIPNTTIILTTTKLNSKILIQWNSGIAQEASSGDTDEISFRVRRSISGADVDVREDNQWSYYNTSTSWLGPGQFHMMHLDSPAQAASTAVQYKLMGLVQNSTGKIWLPYSEGGATNNMQIVAMELDV